MQKPDNSFQKTVDFVLSRLKVSIYKLSFFYQILTNVQYKKFSDPYNRCYLIREKILKHEYRGN